MCNFVGSQRLQFWVLNWLHSSKILSTSELLECYSSRNDIRETKSYWYREQYLNYTVNAPNPRILKLFINLQNLNCWNENHNRPGDIFRVVKLYDVKQVSATSTTISELLNIPASFRFCRLILIFIWLLVTLSSRWMICEEFEKILIMIGHPLTQIESSLLYNVLISIFIISYISNRTFCYPVIRSPSLNPTLVASRVNKRIRKHASDLWRVFIELDLLEMNEIFNNSDLKL